MSIGHSEEYYKQGRVYPNMLEMWFYFNTWPLAFDHHWTAPNTIAVCVAVPTY